MSEVAQVQAYRDRIDEMDGISLNIAQLEKTNARCRLRSSHQSGLHCGGMQSLVHALRVWRVLCVHCVRCVVSLASQPLPSALLLLCNRGGKGLVRETSMLYVLYAHCSPTDYLKPTSFLCVISCRVTRCK